MSKGEGGGGGSGHDNNQIMIPKQFSLKRFYLCTTNLDSICHDNYQQNNWQNFSYQTYVSKQDDTNYVITSCHKMS